jgi:hypothetical protein
MTYADKLHAAIERFYEAERLANAVETPLEGTPEEAAMFAAIDDIERGGYVSTTHAGAMAALRLLQKEVHNFASGPMTCPLIDGAMAYFDHIEMNGVDPVRDALNMVEYFPSMMEVSGTGFSAISDGLGVCIEALGAICNQPRCSDGSKSINAAGEYLEGVEQFLMFEQRRVINAAASYSGLENHAEAEARLRTVLAFKAQDADLSANRLQELIGLVETLDRGTAA